MNIKIRIIKPPVWFLQLTKELEESETQLAKRLGYGFSWIRDAEEKAVLEMIGKQPKEVQEACFKDLQKSQIISQYRWIKLRYEREDVRNYDLRFDEEKEVIILTQSPKEAIEEFIKKFKEKFPKAKIEMIKGDEHKKD